MGKPVKMPSLNWMDALPPPPLSGELDECEEEDDDELIQDMRWNSLEGLEIHFSAVPAFVAYFKLKSYNFNTNGDVTLFKQSWEKLSVFIQLYRNWTSRK